MSTTYIGVIVTILATLLPKFGISIGSEELTITLQTLMVIGSSIWIMWRRFRVGDISPLGRRL